ncbi:hypothetical protein D3874_04610 [Oleomonas cavernae]|uniref:Uncharacterized protein n=1 Tax=Oleomonas cavernae TaxID=2320859 RepID=A0A418W8Q6_9PROT|nr:hypothetical protein [Oleomonas cavernae]RJF86393.1 hypothetical protein D3874_04610 [Oleomonas cavernae]
MSEPARVTIQRGSLYLTRDVYDRYFGGLQAVVLLRRETALLVMPVRHAAGGGYLLKQRNGTGDRVVTAADFFREQGMDDDLPHILPAQWSTEQVGLWVADAFK